MIVFPVSTRIVCHYRAINPGSEGPSRSPAEGARALLGSYRVSSPWTSQRYAARSPRVLDDLVAEVCTLVANHRARTNDQYLDLTLLFVAETALQVGTIHRRFPFIAADITDSLRTRTASAWPRDAARDSGRTRTGPQQ